MSSVRKRLMWFGELSSEMKVWMFSRKTCSQDQAGTHTRALTFCDAFTGNTTSTHLWAVVVNQVQVDPQLPHALKRISEPQTDNENPKKTNSTLRQSSNFLFEMFNPREG